MRLLVLDGAQSIGGTKIYLEEGSVGVLLDFGISYGRWGLYFEEYLKPRPGRGLYDLWALGLIPKVEGLYRRDLMPKDFAPSFEYALEIHGVFLSHAHLDHCGLVGLIREDCPLYTSALSAAIMKALQDSGQTDFYGEFAYCNPRAPKTEDARALATHSQRPYRGRPLRSVLGGTPQDLQRFWQTPPNPKASSTSASRAKKLEAPCPQPAPDRLEELRFRAFAVDHSIPGAVAYLFYTDAGPVVYTGDLRLHGRHGDQTRRFVEAVARERPYLLIVEGTRLGREPGEPITEEQVYENALQIVQRSRGKLVIADFGPRHIERLETFLNIAQETQRRLLVFTKDAYLLEALAYADSAFEKVLRHPALGIFDELRLDPRGWEEGLRGRYNNLLVTAEEVRADPASYVLAFSFYDMNDLLDIHPQEGVYIYSSSEAYGEDARVDLWRLWNWLKFYQMAVHGFCWVGSDERGGPEFSGGLHASGHISAEDLLWLIKEIKPRYLLPVHTEHREWFVQALAGEPIRVVLTPEGEWFADARS
ncbi:MAG: MBL fold metallo-hydrolase RNA specificity domain-containing protein [Candidatus Bipolaricaulota bacterium]|nr:ribonuclease J [Candidatus Bipolaricaulota bacterium]MDW8110065.1 MBL fold metallo-hydrolase RNA specificity domain-containing protein [Candidatus Bipolaricaulota bacterium]MDW8329600.1 MBL fold metallo-hydrolase RNA specificity domain-containing protein [Candidatus Bipolaricaulota bacterium]